MSLQHRYFIELAYKGSHFHGWQIQPNAITVQEELNNALSLLAKTPIETMGCGRTDTGVHASQFYAHFDSTLPIEEVKLWVKKLNAILKEAIYIFDIHLVTNDAHARFDATSRSYSYYIAKHKTIFLRDLMWFTPIKLDVAYLNALTDILKSTKHFESFSKTGVEPSTYACEITEAHWTEHEHSYQFTISANRFLRGMVRAIVGTMYEFNKFELPVSELQTIIDSNNRSK
ncbi:MAG: tRNA pseudouridine(38-40) synthase TruA, partial [Bacteroidota bacterium]